MSDNRNDYGYLLNKDIKLHRMWFKQLIKQYGINCIYKAPLPGKTFDKHGDLDADYLPGKLVGCIFQDHPDQKPLEKWVELLSYKKAHLSSMFHMI